MNEKQIQEIETEYREEINNWNWDQIVSNCKENEEYHTCFIGTVFSVFPSGKFYTPWANSNVTEEEALRDEIFREVLEEIAEEHGLFLENGEGDPCDIFLTLPSDDDDSEED